MTKHAPARSPKYYVDAEDFRLERKIAYLSQKEAASYLGVTPRTIRNWESGRYRIPYPAFRLVRLRAGGIVHAKGWDGWRFGRDGALFTPDGRSFKPWELYNIRHVFSMAEHFRKAHGAVRAKEGAPRPLVPALRIVAGGQHG